jgi:hypothetical protein
VRSLRGKMKFSSINFIKNLSLIFLIGLSTSSFEVKSEKGPSGSKTVEELKSQLAQVNAQIKEVSSLDSETEDESSSQDLFIDNDFEEIETVDLGGVELSEEDLDGLSAEELQTIEESGGGLLDLEAGLIGAGAGVGAGLSLIGLKKKESGQDSLQNEDEDIEENNKLKNDEFLSDRLRIWNWKQDLDESENKHISSLEQLISRWGDEDDRLNSDRTIDDDESWNRREMEFKKLRSSIEDQVEKENFPPEVMEKLKTLKTEVEEVKEASDKRFKLAVDFEKLAGKKRNIAASGFEKDANQFERAFENKIQNDDPARLKILNTRKDQALKQVFQEIKAVKALKLDQPSVFRQQGIENTARKNPKSIEGVKKLQRRFRARKNAKKGKYAMSRRN